ncbi:FliM/FliN family flagellar motor switch protein [Paracoccus sp. DMF-8]|uniref:FliM/FliN family flagellar motor switch protein n=1 Tax=Paracoccus sp. DMF-8 TaxID=3019445 RepID=UPI0023E3B42D|nr:FliM/FliN family flagellar motor switch protein [Paracoccus sp. DMF-8]MDF3608392.1 FliM/FliN family flagellar motor switch protein [Paracoccus sp. DMF-8]
MNGKDDSIPGQRQGDPAARQAASHAAVLQRIIAQARRIDPPNPTAEDKASTRQQSLEKLIGTALGRTAEKLYALPVFVQDIQLGASTLAELPELLPEQALLAVVEGRAAAIGVVALSPTLVASVIEMQAIGRVSGREVRMRKPTRTDASISADFVNMLLSELGKELAAQTALPAFSAFSYASFLDDPRPLMLMLEDVALTRVTLNFRIGAGGQRDGSIVIALPTPHMPDPKSRPSEKPLLTGAPGAQNTVPGRAPANAILQQGTPEPMATSSETLALAMQDAPVHLVGILCRKKVSLGSLRNLVPGALIPLPPAALDDARLETRHGQLLAQGRRGRSDGYHAIRLRAAAKPDQSHRVMRPNSAGHRATPGFPQVDITEPDAFRMPASDAGPAEVTPVHATDGAAAFDIGMSQPGGN